MMHYFTPDVLIRSNSPDAAVTDAADADWESAVAAYRNHLASIRDALPAPVLALADLCLHDAAVVAWNSIVTPVPPSRHLPSRPPRPRRWSKSLLASVRSDDVITTLFYALHDDVRATAARTEFPFSDRSVEWLYDEVDLLSTGPNAFLHRILLSSGREVEVPFTSVLIHRISLSTPVVAAAWDQPLQFA